MAELRVRLPRMVSLSETALRKHDEWIEHEIAAKESRRRDITVKMSDSFFPEVSGWRVRTRCGRFIQAAFAQEIPDWVSEQPERIVPCQSCEKSKTPAGHYRFEIILYTDHSPVPYNNRWGGKRRAPVLIQTGVRPFDEVELERATVKFT